MKFMFTYTSIFLVCFLCILSIMSGCNNGHEYAHGSYYCKTKYIDNLGQKNVVMRTIVGGPDEVAVICESAQEAIDIRNQLEAME